MRSSRANVSKASRQKQRRVSSSPRRGGRRVKRTTSPKRTHRSQSKRRKSRRAKERYKGQGPVSLTSIQITLNSIEGSECTVIMSDKGFTMTVELSMTMNVWMRSDLPETGLGCLRKKEEKKEEDEKLKEKKKKLLTNYTFHGGKVTTTAAIDYKNSGNLGPTLKIDVKLKDLFLKSRTSLSRDDPICPPDESSFKTKSLSCSFVKSATSPSTQLERVSGGILVGGNEGDDVPTDEGSESLLVTLSGEPEGGGDRTTREIRIPSISMSVPELDTLFSMANEYDAFYNQMNALKAYLLVTDRTIPLNLALQTAVNARGGQITIFTSDLTSNSVNTKVHAFSTKFNLETIQFQDTSFLNPLLSNPITNAFNQALNENVDLQKDDPPNYKSLISAMQTLSTILKQIKPETQRASDHEVGNVALNKVSIRRDETRKNLIVIDLYVADALLRKIINEGLVQVFNKVQSSISTFFKKAVSSPKGLLKNLFLQTNNRKKKEPTSRETWVERINGDRVDGNVTEHVKRVEVLDLLPHRLKQLYDNERLWGDDEEDNKKRRQALVMSLFGQIGLRRELNQTRLCLDGYPCFTNIVFEDGGRGCTINIHI